MARFLADENFNSHIIRGLLRRNLNMGKSSSPLAHPLNPAYINYQHHSRQCLSRYIRRASNI